MPGVSGSRRRHDHRRIEIMARRFPRCVGRTKGAEVVVSDYPRRVRQCGGAEEVNKGGAAPVATAEDLYPCAVLEQVAALPEGPDDAPDDTSPGAGGGRVV
jgi:hypothetical protein